MLESSNESSSPKPRSRMLRRYAWALLAIGIVSCCKFTFHGRCIDLSNEWDPRFGPVEKSKWLAWLPRLRLDNILSLDRPILNITDKTIASATVCKNELNSSASNGRTAIQRVASEFANSPSEFVNRKVNDLRGTTKNPAFPFGWRANLVVASRKRGSTLTLHSRWPTRRDEANSYDGFVVAINDGKESTGRTRHGAGSLYGSRKHPSDYGIRQPRLESDGSLRICAIAICRLRF